MHMESVRSSVDIVVSNAFLIFNISPVLLQAYDLGLENQVIAVSSDHISAKNRYIFAHNQIHKLPSGIRGLFKTQSLLSKNLLPILLKEPLVPKKESKDDESIYSFISRRLNSEVTYQLWYCVCKFIYIHNISLIKYGNSLNLHIHACMHICSDMGVVTAQGIVT